MGAYSIGPDELEERFKEFLQNQEGDVSAEVIVECWNRLARRFQWNENLVAINKFTKKPIED